MADITKFVDRDYEGMDFRELADAPVAAIRGLSEDDARALKDAFGVDTIRELAENKFVRIAQAVVALADPGTVGQGPMEGAASFAPPARGPEAEDSPDACRFPDHVPAPLRVDTDGVVRVGRTRIPLDRVVTAYRAGETAEGIADRYPTLDLGDAYSAIGFYLGHRDEVDAYLAEREREAAEAREEIEASGAYDRTGRRERLLARRAADQQR